jgi:hypothetical protein
MQIMPWSRDQLSGDELRQWLASRKEAGSKIDIATCETGWWYAQVVDPYGIHEALGEFPEEADCVGREYFVRSPESNGWVTISDLPRKKSTRTTCGPTPDIASATKKRKSLKSRGSR